MKLLYSLTLICVICSSVIYGQQQELLNYSFEDVDSFDNILEFNSDASYFSGEIQNHLVSKMITGGIIDRERLMDMSQSMDDRNTFGGWAHAGFRYRARPDSLKLGKSSSLFLEFGMASYGYAEFPRDLFHLSFIGNADRLGETMDLSQTTAEAMVYQYAGLGIMNESRGCYLSFNLLNIQNYFKTEINELSLFTADDASELNFVYDGSVTLNDSLSGNFLSQGGVGFTLNGRYNFKLGNEGKNLASIEVRNIGAAFLNENTHTQSADSTYNFSGINIDDLFQTDNPYSIINLEDSINNTEEFASKTVLMPIDIKANYFYKINEYDHIGIDVRSRFFSAHRPEIGVNYIHQETHKVSYNLGIRYGGYGRLSMHAGAYFTFAKWKTYLSTHNLIGSFLEDAKGRSVSFGLSRTFSSKK